MNISYTNINEKKKDSTHVFGFKKVGQDTFFKSWT